MRKGACSSKNILDGVYIDFCFHFSEYMQNVDIHLVMRQKGEMATAVNRLHFIHCLFDSLLSNWVNDD